MSDSEKQPSLLDIIAKNRNITPEDILDKLMVSDANLPLKTDIRDSALLAVYDTVAQWTENKGYPITAGLLRTYLRCYRENQVSKGRKGREEVIKALVARASELGLKVGGESPTDSILGRRK